MQTCVWLSRSCLDPKAVAQAFTASAFSLSCVPTAGPETPLSVLIIYLMNFLYKYFWLVYKVMGLILTISYKNVIILRSFENSSYVYLFVYLVCVCKCRCVYATVGLQVLGVQPAGISSTLPQSGSHLNSGFQS